MLNKIRLGPGIGSWDKALRLLAFAVLDKGVGGVLARKEERCSEDGCEATRYTVLWRVVRMLLLCKQCTEFEFPLGIACLPRLCGTPLVLTCLALSCSRCHLPTYTRELGLVVVVQMGMFACVCAVVVDTALVVHVQLPDVSPSRGVE